MARPPEVRVAKALRLKVRGRDSAGNPFVQTVNTIDISRHGARLDGLRCLQGPGEEIELRRWWKKARFRVVWVGHPGAPEADQVGIVSLEPGKNFWGLEFPAPKPQARRDTAGQARSQARISPAQSHGVAASVPEREESKKIFSVRVRCPYGDEDMWLTLRNQPGSMTEIQNTQWAFDCPVHGVQLEIPLEVREAAAPPEAAGTQRPTPTGPLNHTMRRTGARRGPRLPLGVPLLVYGWTLEGDAFLEESSTVLVNANGGLVPLGVRTAIGQKVLVVNKTTRQSQECRVAYVGAPADGKANVGIAFKSPADHFWGPECPSS